MKIEKALQLDIEQLYEQIGLDLSSDLGLGEADPKSNRQRGRRWLNKNKELLRKQVCGSQVVRLVSKQDRQWDQMLLTAAVADLIMSLSLGISPVTVAALLVKEGLVQLCEITDEK